MSSYCRSESCRPDQLVRLSRRGFAGSETSTSYSSVPAGVGAIVRSPRSSSSIGSTPPRSPARSTWSPTSSSPVAYASDGSGRSASSRADSPLTSVITTRLFSTSRTTIRPSVLATSGSSTPASWVFVPVDPLATASPVSELADGASALEEESSIAPPDPRMVVQRGHPTRRDRPGRWCGRRTTTAAPRSCRTGSGRRRPGPGRARVDENGGADQAAEDERGDQATAEDRLRGRFHAPVTHSETSRFP